MFVDGVRVEQLGLKVSPNSKITIDDKQLPQSRELNYIALNKPRLTITSRNDENDRDTIYKVIPEKLSHLNPVGRLDYDTSGLLLMTNDGELLYKLTHPKFQVKRVYRVLCYDRISDYDISNLQKGVLISKDQLTHPDSVIRQGKHILITLHEGRYHHIKRMIEAIGNRVDRMKRVEYAGIRIGGIAPGKWRHLSQKEIRILQRLGN